MHGAASCRCCGANNAVQLFPRQHWLRRPRHTRKGIRPTAETCDPHSFLLLLLRRSAHGFWRHWILVMFRQRGIHEIPRLRVAGPHVPRGLKPTRIVQARGVNAAELRVGIEFGNHRRPAVRAEPAMDVPATRTLRPKESRRALQQLHRFNWHNDRRHKPRASEALAIAAVALNHANRFDGTIVANRAARTSSGKWDFDFGHGFDSP